jgi:hypothetical protein
MSDIDPFVLIDKFIKTKLDKEDYKVINNLFETIKLNYACAQNHIKNLEKEAAMNLPLLAKGRSSEMISNDFFRQAYCTALPSCVEHWEKRFLGTTGKSPSETTVAWAVELAEESVRQVGELNKEQARDS